MPDLDAPLSEFRGWVKFMRPSFRNEAGNALMNKVFTRFERQGGGISDHTRGQIQKARRDGTIREAMFINALRRRYAGDSTMVRGAYYSVCSDEHGNDGGSLARELSAYCEPGAEHLAIVHDLVMPDQAELLHQYCQAPAGLAVELPPTKTGRPNRIHAHLIRRGLSTDDDGRSEGVVVFLPLAVAWFEVPDVLDLRQLAAQQWLAEFLPAGNETFSMPYAGEISHFCEMLPSLMSPERGGSDIDSGIGILLRRSGVNGLVFPSARSDVLCEYVDGELSRFAGWNFLDYREAPPLEMVQRMVFQDDWLTSFGETTVHLAPDDSPYAGSWRLEDQEAQMPGILATMTHDNLEVLALLNEQGDDPG